MSPLDELDQLLTPGVGRSGDAVSQFLAELSASADGPAPTPSDGLAAFLDQGPAAVTARDGSRWGREAVGARTDRPARRRRTYRRVGLPVLASGWLAKAAISAGAVVLAGTAVATVRQVHHEDHPQLPTPTPTVTTAPPSGRATGRAVPHAAATHTAAAPHHSGPAKPVGRTRLSPPTDHNSPAPDRHAGHPSGSGDSSGDGSGTGTTPGDGSTGGSGDGGGTGGDTGGTGDSGSGSGDTPTGGSTEPAPHPVTNPSEAPTPSESPTRR